MSFFSNPDAVARYPEGPVRLVRGFDGLQHMTTVLLREQVPATGNVLVLGAGGGLELKRFADAEPSLRFVGVEALCGVCSGLGGAGGGCRTAITAISARLPVLSPEQDAALMQDAGFEDVELFYAGFSFNGWVGYKPR
ncbi:hypothetical protein [Pseudomonas sp. M5A4_2d]